MNKIPNAITLCNAICGVLVILLGSPVIGAYLIITAMILDTVDGLVARALNVKSELGKQLDSLSDLVSFGVAPAYLFYHLFTDTEALLASIFYVLSALFRLAKFNVQDSKRDFNGLPTPAAAGIVSGYILIFSQDNVISPQWLPMTAIVLTAICMNIRMSFFSLKEESVMKDWKLWFVISSTVGALIIDASFALIICFWFLYGRFFCQRCRKKLEFAIATGSQGQLNKIQCIGLAYPKLNSLHLHRSLIR